MEIEWRADEPLTSEFFFRVSVDSKQTVDYNTTGNRVTKFRVQEKSLTMITAKF